MVTNLLPEARSILIVWSFDYCLGLIKLYGPKNFYSQVSIMKEREVYICLVTTDLRFNWRSLVSVVAGLRGGRQRNWVQIPEKVQKSLCVFEITKA
jgi:hypothetical protein